MEINIYFTKKLNIGYYDLGNPKHPVVFLIHGWPDDATAWKIIAERLQNEGYRVIIPYLRGFGSTVFNGDQWIRDGSSFALVQDTIDLADGLFITNFFVAGHDWGSRVAYQLAALYPVRVNAIAALALAYQPRGEFHIPNFLQAKNFWYQWLMMFDTGVESIAKNPIGFARIQWDTWSPEGWFDDATFEKVADSFKNPDWVAITINGYRRRFGWAPTDSDYAQLSRQISITSQIHVPTLMLQGGADNCDPASESEGQEVYFTKSYKRVVLAGIGHFPMREAPNEVADELIMHFNLFR